MKRDTKRRFNALLYTFCCKGNISEEKAANLSAEDKKFMCNVIARSRAPILSVLIPDDPEFISWLNCMGYDYTYINKQGLQFNGTSAHYIKYGVRQPSGTNKHYV